NILMPNSTCFAYNGALSPLPLQGDFCATAGKVFHHQLKDDAGMEKWGLLSDAAPFARPAYTATTMIVNQLQGALFEANHSDTTQDYQGFYRFDFNKEDQFISVLWSRSNDDEVTVLIPGELRSAAVWNQSGQVSPATYVSL
ncbi:MAG: hypothetical protein JXA33_27610, partial [Anaerolineae bacterium]|nr:hypothetical protein [Anaerolineae bacterium]